MKGIIFIVTPITVEKPYSEYLNDDWYFPIIGDPIRRLRREEPVGKIPF